MAERRKSLTKDDELKLFFEYGVNPATRRIILSSAVSDIEGGESGVDAEMWKRLAVGLSVLERWPVLEGQSSDIVIEISNPGGDAYHMFGIYNRIQKSPHRIVMEAYGYLMSAATIIYQAADHRVIAPDATVMLHYGSDGFYGHSKDFQTHAIEAERINRRMEDIYLSAMAYKADKNGRKPMTRRQLKEKMKFDWFIPADEAVSLGLADEVAQYHHTPSP